MKEEIKMFLKRSVKFEKNAVWNLEQGDYDLAVFHVEQAMQLLVKAKLLELAGDFPKTHSIIALLELLYKITRDEKIKKFIKENRVKLARLIDAYVSSRYFVREFYREEAIEALNLFKELKKLLKVEKFEQ